MSKVTGDGLAELLKRWIEGQDDQMFMRAARIRRNPRTGDPVAIPARLAVHFVPGESLTKKVRDAEGRRRRASRRKPR
jgi:hypothetical protein